ncbi:MAG: PAS domain-containing protein, partial [Candidatus Omnitrophica bacterium]|nr:PAS domain-containing protein [Candidatus Omnitrophota bacterium]
AKDKQGQAVGVILSGVGSDGSSGMRAIRSAGGATFAQEPASAQYDSMPRSAIAARCVDHVLGPKAIAAKLMTLSRHLQLGGAEGEGVDKLLALAQTDLTKIFVLLQYHTGVDFSYYKKATIERRIRRRLVVTQKPTLKRYLGYLRSAPKEVEALFQDILINVTGFFRDPALFKTLQKELFPALFKGRVPGQPVRVWVPACSTGEEAYSLAIALFEASGGRGRACSIQVFGTDVNSAVIEKARRGWYPQSIKADVPARILGRYFVREKSGYRIARFIRDVCVFAVHDLTRDPPFSKLDVVSCRNVFIYVDPALQKKITPLFHYGLNPGGILVLGSAETVCQCDGLFAPFKAKLKIFVKKEVPGSRIAPLQADRNRPATRKTASPKSRLGAVGAIIDKKLIQLGEGSVGEGAEDNQARNEQLRSALEEIQSANEELQSSNEELETSKEELQATNEELITLNDELTNRNTELAGLNSDILNLFNSTRMPVIMVGRDFCIRRFTPAAQKVWNIIPSDVGRRLSDLSPNVRVNGLAAMLKDAVDHLKITEAEVRDRHRRWYSLTVSPYKTVDHKIDGAVIALADIHSVKTAQERDRAAAEYFRNLVEAVPESLLVLDRGLRVITANRGFYRFFKTSPGYTEGCLIHMLGNGQWNIPALRKLLKEVLTRNKSVEGVEITHDFESIGTRVMLVSARAVTENLAGERMILVGIRDITAHRQVAEALKASE